MNENSTLRYVGLSQQQVETSRLAHGTNVLTPRERLPWWRKLAEKFTDPLIVILLVAAVLSIGISCYEYFRLDAGTQAFFEPVGIIVAILLATVLAFWFEQKAGREFQLLSQQNDLEPVRVIRDGKETQVPRRDIVVDDIVLLATGDEIPADGLLLEATLMQVDESTLTGEPVCAKSVLKEFVLLLHPRAVIGVRISGHIVPDDRVRRALAFIFLYIILVVIAMLCYSLLGADVDTALGSSISMLSNVGPATGSTGPASNFAHVPAAGKWLMSAYMLIGRLEIFTILFLLMPSFWRERN